ncbi:DUF58 domain-containing protein [Iamia sp. SCSIO 61187]|uniref:DUF58 domain-containing protein n=1 Tax=Iamia sp. SCSIO 61187 TaxID=2722752 RepID=UPI001C62F413|nr:DUF58 domain-containing protein [Iamia sp. SCSIO 61187]QYG92781.1 DUF58 domain-containing protein [Iamia sp. SCSIO 61187]
MITRPGALVLAGSVALAVAGRLLGLVEAYVLAAAGGLLVIVAVAQVLVLQPRLRVRRSVRPERVHVGTPARVEIDVASVGRVATPVLTLVDPIGDRAGARLRLAPLPVGGTVRAAYRLPTRTRGEVSVGPLQVEVADPFGLAHRRQVVADKVRLVVLPHVDPIRPLPPPAGAEPLSGQEGRPGLGRSGDEFHTLRPYVVGDDIRRVHWPMSARSDDLVVRQDDEPRQGRLTVVLDVTSAHTSTDGFERMVSAAASIAAAHWQRGDIVRLLTSDHQDTGWATGVAAYDNLMEVLAVAARSARADLDRVLGLTDAGAHAIVVVTGGRPDADIATLAGHRARRAGHRAGMTVVRFLGHAPADRVGGIRGVRIVDVGPSRPFPLVWEDARVRRRTPVGSRP